MNQKLKKVMALCLAAILTMTFGIIAFAASPSIDAADDTVANSEEKTQKKSTGQDSGDKSRVRVNITKIEAMSIRWTRKRGEAIKN